MTVVWFSISVDAIEPHLVDDRIIGVAISQFKNRGTSCMYVEGLTEPL